MLFVRVSIFLVLSLSVNTNKAMEDGAIYPQQSQPIVIGKKKDSRQRGGCGTSQDVWALNICETDKFCYTNQSQVSLWLGERPKEAGMVKLENTETGNSVDLRWKASAETLVWPVKKFPIQPNTFYWVEISTRTFRFSKKIVLQQIPADRKTLAEKTKWMEDNGCTSQAKMLREKTPFKTSKLLFRE